MINHDENKYGIRRRHGGTNSLHRFGVVARRYAFLVLMRPQASSLFFALSRIPAIMLYNDEGQIVAKEREDFQDLQKQ
jgi:hypothetical protein